MKGIVFNLLEEFVREGWGDEAYETVLEACPLHTTEPFVGPGTYPDTDLFAIATGVARHLGLTLPDALRAFGRYCFPHLAESVPDVVAAHPTSRELLLVAHDVIHVEVRKLMPDAQPPSFTFREQADGVIHLTYTSDRKLCAFLEGLLEGLAEYFGETVVYEHTACMHDGAAHCDLNVAFSRAEEHAA